MGNREGVGGGEWGGIITLATCRGPLVGAKTETVIFKVFLDG